MGKRKEIHNHVFFAQRNGMFMGTKGCQIHSVSHHHTLAQSRSATGIEDTSQVILIIFSSTVLHLCLMLQGFAQLQKLIKIQAHLILCILHHGRIKDYQFGQMVAYLQHTISRVILILFAHKNITDVGIAHNILHLHLTAGSIKRNRSCTNAVCTKIYIQTLGHVLGKDCHVFLHPHTQFQQSITYLANVLRKLIPGNGIPFAQRIIAEQQGCPLSVMCSLIMYQD